MPSMTATSEMSSRMGRIHSDEACANLCIRMRCALPGQIRSKEETVRAWRNILHSGKQLLHRFLFRKLFLKPAERVAGGKRDSHRIEGIFFPMIEIMNESAEIKITLCLIGEDDPRGANAAKSGALT